MGEAGASTTTLKIAEGLVPAGNVPVDRVAEAERALRLALEEVNALDAEIDELSGKLEAFTRRHDEALRSPHAALDRAERLVRRLQSLHETVRRWLAELRSPPPPPSAPEPPARGTRRRPRRVSARKVDPPPPPPEDGEAESEPEEEAATIPEREEDEGRLLKRLLRRLARVLHPDLARDQAERERLHHLMAQVNAAYERGDRVALEVMAEKVGAGEPPGELTEQERLAHLARRLEALRQAARSLRQERDRLRATDTYRLLAEAERSAARGRDFLEDAAAELEAEEGQALQDAWSRLRMVAQVARELSDERERKMSTLARSGRGAGLRAFDPVLESPLVRRSVLRLERRGATPEARALARELEEAVEGRPWEVALALLASFCELAGGPPETLSSPDGWRARYDALRAGWTDAPSLERMLTALPPHLELGFRRQDKAVHFGVQLRSAELLAGVAIALEHEKVAALGREVLKGLGPRERCRACGEEVGLIHLLRTRGLDELHALVCPRCFAAQKRYFLFSRSDGLEALNPHALRLGVVVEQVVRFGGASIAFQLLAEERPRLTAAELVRRVVECYLVPYKVEVPPEAVRLFAGKKELQGMDPVPGGTITARLDRRAGVKDRDVLELLRTRIERRFRPESPGGVQSPR
jgi:hypothetical protein